MKKLCKRCLRQLKQLQKENQSGGRYCPKCGFWRYDKDKKKVT